MKLDHTVGLLSYNEICTLIELGVIENAMESSINGSSLDIHLGTSFIFEDQNSPAGTISLAKREPFQSITLTTGNPVYIDPGEFVLAHSVEVFNLPTWLSAEYKLKSSMARVGLEHMNAGWCDPGWHGSVLTLEFCNMLKKHTISIQAGDAIGQVIFFKHSHVPFDKSYGQRGRYNLNTNVQEIKK
jgi:dCTP deaminase